MIRLSRKSLLALEAVLDVALHARPNPVQARDITARQGVPQRYLEQVMQALVRAGICAVCAARAAAIGWPAKGGASACGKFLK